MCYRNPRPRAVFPPPPPTGRPDQIFETYKNDFTTSPSVTAAALHCTVIISGTWGHMGIDQSIKVINIQPHDPGVKSSETAYNITPVHPLIYTVRSSSLYTRSSRNAQ